MSPALALALIPPLTLTLTLGGPNNGQGRHEETAHDQRQRRGSYGLHSGPGAAAGGDQPCPELDSIFKPHLAQALPMGSIGHLRP